jgi:hypothetical protein
MNLTSLKMGFKNKSLILALVAFIALPGFSQAQVIRENLGVEITNDFVLEPAKNEVILEPGQSTREKISIINRMDKSVTFQIQVEDIVGSDNMFEQVKLLGEDRGPYSLKDFIIPEITEFTLESGEKITIPVDVNLPTDSEPRGYYGALIVSSKGEESNSSVDDGASGTTQIVTRLGSIFLVRVNGDLLESSRISDFKTVGPEQKLYSDHPKGFEVSVKNEGNVHLVHYGEIKIKNMLGREVGSLPINAFFSLPDSTRYREIKWPESFAFGFYSAEVYLYQGFGDENEFLNDKISFFVLPWKLVVIALTVAIILFAIIRFIKSNFKIERKK